MEGYKFPLLRTPVQKKIPLNTPLKENQNFLVERNQRNVGEGSNKENLATQRSACSKSISEQSFSCKEKKMGVYRAVINLKTLNPFVYYMHFKMESLQTLKYMMKEKDYMCETDLKDAYFTVLLDKSCCQSLQILVSVFSSKF